MLQKLFFILLVIHLVACSPSSETKQEAVKETPKELGYAKRFAIKKTSEYTILEILGDKESNRVTATFILYKQQKPNYNKDAYYIKIPVTKVASMSSIYTTMIDELNSINTIVAIDNVDYYNNTLIKEKVKNHTISELSKGPSIEVEKTLALQPDLLLTFGMGNPKNDVDQKLVQANLPIAISLDHLEETPLARAEWIKFVACFFDKETLADSLFSVTEKNYNQLKTLTESVATKATVLTEIKYGDAWYVPSGKSYIANLLKDAGANYFWANESNSGSIPLSFETVYAKAKDCDFWINLYNVNTRKDLTQYDSRYTLFKAYKNGNLYNNNKIQNENGYSNYWETGITHPDAILKDLISIFYPQLLPNQALSYYKKIN